MKKIYYIPAILALLAIVFFGQGNGDFFGLKTAFGYGYGGSSAKAIVEFNFPEGQGVINETDHTIAVNVPYGTDVTALIPTYTITGVSSLPASGIANNFTSPQTYTVTAEDVTTQDYIVTVSILTETQTAPDASGNATADSGTPEVVITNPDQAVTVTVANGTDADIDVSAFIAGGTGTIPQITINSDDADIEIPGSTTVTSEDPTWNGVIAAPTATTVTLPDVSGEDETLGAAIEIGFASTKLSFDKAVRILLPGQSGKRVIYTRDGGVTHTEITTVCAADNQATGDALAADGDCKISVGSDMVVWTKHFTTFATYTSTATSAPATSSGGGGGGGIIGPSDAYANWLAQNAQAATPTPTPTGQVLGEQAYADGALIRAKGDIDVYIVKYVGAKKFKRLILSPSVFNSYGHLKWSDVLNVEQSVLDSFTTSDLVRAQGNTKVYKLTASGDTGTKQWITTAVVFNSLGLDWAAIYEVNLVDLNSYVTGENIK